GNYADHLLAELRVSGQPGAKCEVAELTVWEGAEVYERLLVGYPQDASTGQATYVILEGSDWSDPLVAEIGLCRALLVPAGLDEAAIGKTICHFYSMLQDVVYAIEVTYRREPGADLSLAVSRNGSPLTSAALDGQTGIWVTQKLVLDVGAREFPIAERARL